MMLRKVPRGQSGKFGFARTYTGKVSNTESLRHTESGGFSMSIFVCFSTNSANTDVMMLKLPIMNARTTDNQETSFRVHFTAAPLNHSGTLGEELSYVPSRSQQKHPGSGRVMNKSYMSRPLLSARH